MINGYLRCTSHLLFYTSVTMLPDISGYSGSTWSPDTGHSVPVSDTYTIPPHDGSCLPADTRITILYLHQFNIIIHNIKKYI